MRSEGYYQYALIISGIAATALFGVFFKRELFPEYKIYQNDYVALEKFRSTYSHEPPPPFVEGIKQVVFERKDNGPPGVERCISCHVALDIPYFSPTKLVHDAEGKTVVDAQGNPLKTANEDYVWKKLDEAIADLTDPAAIEKLQKAGQTSKIAANQALAEQYRALKTAHVGDYVYDVTKVLQMHPLIGRETRPFEFHPLNEYGCVSCHNGNGQGLTTDKAHGPVFDEQYEIEFEGPEPKFTEEDPENDPSFSLQFNHKPGPALIFQTTPIFTGALVQAKCMVCHQDKQEVAQVAMGMPGMPPKALTDKESQLVQLTQNYQRGKELFLSQACYACHKIAGFSRGGVGPELTREGLNYPWFIKQSIVWPQADVPASTMPNYHLDHLELQDLMTFLLAQVGEKSSISTTDYKVNIKEWEGGKKNPWEQPLVPSQVQEVRYGMKVFATEGCAACHRLKGFESDVGFSVELQAKPSIEELQKQRRWFTGLIPEQIAGSHLVQVLQEHAQEIDQRLADHVRQGSILEEIERDLPGTLESFYTSFQYAARAKNHELLSLADAEKNQEKKQAILQQLQQWKERVRRVLLMFIQEYGLGRLVGPRPNWSGVYRSDEWLMEHFHNPSSHVARSIMPVFPFDDSKFYALTHMLDVLGQRNRDAVREIWTHNGFSPSEAYQIHCSQCHGEYKEGNGPVASWIYPIPKNLNNPEFLRNLTKERVMQSILHGVKGTPMPPWGEVGEHKPYLQDRPVLSESEVKQLVDWLFSDLPGGEVIKSSKDVQKWHYTPEDVIQELIKEGSQLKGQTLQQDASAVLMYSLPRGEGLLASLAPMPTPKPDVQGSEVNKYVEAVFEVRPSLEPGPDHQAYYIKKEYYTPENIEAGKQFFEMNCAVCHGTEGDGLGTRAEFMKDAKPRMLINLDWLKTRDDLRLLRSIKYGVPGTAMTPWGDFTSSLQRLQLVIFIRSLSEKHLQLDALNESLYKAFDSSLVQVEKARSLESPMVETAKQKYEQFRQARTKGDEQYQGQQDQSKNQLEVYQNELAALAQWKRVEGVDEQLAKLSRSISAEKELYQRLGMALLNSDSRDSDFPIYLELVALNQGRYSLVKDELKVDFHEADEERRVDLEKRILEAMNGSIMRLQQQKPILEGKIASVERSRQLKQLDAEISSLSKLKTQFESSFEKAKHLRQEQQKLYQAYAQPSKTS